MNLPQFPDDKVELIAMRILKMQTEPFYFEGHWEVNIQSVHKKKFAKSCRVEHLTSSHLEALAAHFTTGGN